MIHKKIFLYLLALVLLTSLSAAQEGYEATRDTLRTLERERPRPVKKIQQVVNGAVKSEQWSAMSTSQKTEIINYVLEATQREKGSDKAMELAQEMLDNNQFAAPVAWHLRFRKAEFAFGTSDKGQVLSLATEIVDSSDAPNIYKGRAEMLMARAYEFASRPSVAIEHAEKALKYYDEAYATEEAEFSYDVVNEIKWAGSLARDVLLDSKKSMYFFKKMQEYTDGDYWAVPAQLEIALIYRKDGEYEKAQAIYDDIEKLEDKRYASRTMLPRAEMTWFEIGDAVQGKELMRAVLQSQDVHHTQRYRTLLEVADYMVKNGHYDEALKWYSDNMELPHQPEKAVKEYRSTILYRMGHIYQRKGQIDKAKEAYRNAMNAEGGDMDDRINARDALERIIYFE